MNQNGGVEWGKLDLREGIGHEECMVKYLSEKEFAVIKEAPVSAFVLFCFGCLCAYFLLSERLYAMNEQIRLYEKKLDVSSPEEALKKMKTLNKETQAAIETTRFNIKELIRDTDPSGCGWTFPICVSLDDSVETQAQVMLYTLVAREKDPNFVGDYCKTDGFWDRTLRGLETYSPETFNDLKNHKISD